MNNIKILVMDVDGTLTDGKIYISAHRELVKAFNIKDGYGIVHLLRDAHITPVIITGRKSEIVKTRSDELGIKYLYQGIENKMDILYILTQELKITFDNIAYMGDDLNDLECMKNVYLSGCPSDSCNEVKRVANYICQNKGGDGAVREFIEYIVTTNK